MYKFNNDNIVTGYIKQLLASFNLPNYRVYSRENEVFFDEHGYERDIIATVKKDTSTNPDTYPDHMRYAPYIKNNYIQKYVIDDDGVGSWESDLNNIYYYNRKELNNTRNLQIKNNIYDSYTHEYLGDYLRFQRDYNNINLMSLYNCFSDRVCNNISMTIITGEQEGITQTTSFNSADSNYKIYMLPVKLFKEYTIAIDSFGKPIEVCCGLFDKSLDVRPKLLHLYEHTYKRFNGMRFNSPVIYDKLMRDSLDMDEVDTMEIAQCEKNLKLFIKIPAKNTSSITVLEGNYSHYCDTTYKIRYLLDNNGNRVLSGGSAPVGQYVSYMHTWERTSNKCITNMSHLDEETMIFNPITRPQLLLLNTGTSYPFADRLIEYLTGNVITPFDECPDNIKRTQQVMQLNNYYASTYGLWENKMRPVLYNFMSRQFDDLEHNHDILGYVDKDTEKMYYGLAPIPKKSWESQEEYRQRSGGKHEINGVFHDKVTIAGVDLYDGWEK